MKIYIVQGSTGEYSDHTEWIVCAFTDEQRAKDFVVQATKEGRERKAELDRLESTDYKLYCDLMYDENGMRGTLSDPNFDFDSSGFNYTYFETELR